MPSLIFKKKRVRQPQYAVKANSKHESFSKLRFLRSFTPIFGSTSRDTKEVNPGIGGRGLALTGLATTSVTTETSLPTLATDPFTIELMMSCTSVASLAHLFGFGQDLGTATTGARRMLYAYTGTPLVIYFGGESRDIASDIPVSTSGAVQHIIVTWAGAGNIFFYSMLNGVISRFNGAPSGALLDCVNSNTYTGGIHPAGTVEPTGTIYKRSIYAKYTTDDEAVRMFANPWEATKPAKNLIWMQDAAAGSVGASDGVATVSGVGSSTAASPGSSAGIAAVSGVGASTTTGVGASDGTAAVSGAGISTAASAGASAGVAVVSGVSPSTVEAVGSSSGVATVDGISPIITAESASNWQDTPKNFLWSRKELEPEEVEIIESLAETQAEDLKSTESERKEQLRKALKLRNIDVELKHIEAMNALREQRINAEIAAFMKITQIEAENEEYLELVLLAAAA